MTTKKKVVSSKELLNIKDRIDANRVVGIIPLPKSTGKPATILYKKLPDNMILITEFENFLSLDEIFDKYGRVVATTYSAYSYFMYGIPGSVFVAGLAGFGAIRTGQKYNKVEFSTFVSHVKKCGGLLHDIIQTVNGGEVKKIII